MFNHQIFRCEFGKYYRIYSSTTDFLSANFPPEKFYDLASTKRFVRSLRVPHHHWRNLIQMMNHIVPSQSHVDHIDQVSRLLIRGRLKIAEVQILDPIHHPSEKRTVSGERGEVYQFAPANELAFMRKQNTKSFNKVASAEAFIKKLAPNKAQLESIVEQLKIEAGKPFLRALTEQELRAALAKALFAGKVVVRAVQQKQNRRVRPTIDTIEAIRRPATLGPHSGEVSEVQETWFQLRLMDEVGEAIDGVELVATVDRKHQDLISDNGGKIRIENVSDRFAIISINNEEQLYEILESRWEVERQGDIPSEHILSTLAMPTEVGALTLKNEIEHTVVLTPPHGQLFVELKDKTGQVLHKNREYSITGPQSFSGTTDEYGRLNHQGVIPGNYTLNLNLEFFEQSSEAQSDSYEMPLIVLDPAISEPQYRLIGAVPHLIKASIGGMPFDTNKSFLLPGAVKVFKTIRELCALNNPSQLLLVGHTDTSGEPDVNDALSLERADNTKAYIEDNVDVWLAMYDSSLPIHQRWGSREDRLMLHAMPDVKRRYFSEDIVRWFQGTRGLKIDGIAGPQTRSQLIEEYMALDGVKLEDISGLNIVLSTHGCGENFPQNPLGDESGDSSTENQGDRRVELFFFDNEFGIQPQPTKSNGNEYLTWRERASENHDYIVESVSRKAVILEIQDTLFRTNSCVVLPVGDTPEESHTQRNVSVMNLFATALRYNEEHPGKAIFIAGHTDTTGSIPFNQKLSEERARCTLALLEGDREEFIRLVNNRHTVADYKQILFWSCGAFEDLNFTCHPGAIDNNAYTGIAAIRQFQKDYNHHKAQLGAAHQIELAVDGAIGPLTWGAIFDVYEHALSRTLGEKPGGVSALREKIIWVDKERKSLGFSEHHPIDQMGLDDVRSQANRRVELLFFDAGDEPDLMLAESDPEMSDIYLAAEYKHASIEPMISALPWQAEWSQAICNSETAGTILLQAPGLRAGQTAKVTVANTLTDSTHTIDLISQQDLCTTDFKQWENLLYDCEPRAFNAAENFPVLGYTFTVDVGGRKLSSRNTIFYREKAEIHLNVELNPSTEVSALHYPMSIVTLLGSRPGKTGEGVHQSEDANFILINNVPPGGFCVLIDGAYGAEAFGGRQTS